MSGNGRLSPAQVHAKVKHPIIDGAGHWVEFPSVFAEKMRKVGGDKAAAGFLAPRGGGEAFCATQFLEPPGRKHARPRDRDDAEADPERVDDPQHRVPNVVIGKGFAGESAGAADLDPS
jgi:hypothetical protein